MAKDKMKKVTFKIKGTSPLIPGHMSIFTLLWVGCCYLVNWNKKIQAKWNSMSEEEIFLLYLKAGYITDKEILKAIERNPKSYDTQQLLKTLRRINYMVTGTTTFKIESAAPLIVNKFSNKCVFPMTEEDLKTHSKK